MSRSKDLTGYSFGRFTVIKKVDKPERYKTRGTYWLCQCRCGNTRIYRYSDILRNNSLYCGKCSRNEFDITGEFGIGYTTHGQEFFFDTDDYGLIHSYSWSVNQNGYVVAWDTDTKSIVYMHRLVLGLDCVQDFDVDHINHNTSDNRKENLRICTHQQNIWNSSLSKNNTSGVVGVVWMKDVQKWRAQIYVNGRCIFLLDTVSFEDAVQARKNAERYYFGEYSYMER